MSNLFIKKVGNMYGFTGNIHDLAIKFKMSCGGIPLPTSKFSNYLFNVI